MNKKEVALQWPPFLIIYAHYSNVETGLFKLFFCSSLSWAQVEEVAEFIWTLESVSSHI